MLLYEKTNFVLRAFSPRKGQNSPGKEVDEKIRIIYLLRTSESETCAISYRII